MGRIMLATSNNADEEYGGNIKQYDEGSSGVWEWKKYVNGTFELWGSSEEEATVSTIVWGNIYAIDMAGLGNYPFTIDSITCILGNLTMTNINATCNINAYNLTTAPNYILTRATEVLNRQSTVRKSLYVKGTWH